MRRIAAMVALGIGGFLAAIGLTLGALALAGDDTGSVVQPQLSPSRADRSATPTPSPSADDRGGASGSDDSGSGGDDSGSGGDDSGSGSDNSGSGSDNSGSGSDNSGSGSGSSGSGSGSSGSGDDADDD